MKAKIEIEIKPDKKQLGKVKSHISTNIPENLSYKEKIAIISSLDMIALQLRNTWQVNVGKEKVIT